MKIRVQWMAFILSVFLWFSGCAGLGLFASDPALAQDAKQMSDFALLLNLYAVKNKGRYPAKLEDLASLRENWRLFASSRLATPPALYRYIQGRTQAQAAETVLAVGFPSPRRGRVNVLTVSGKVYDVSADKANAILARP